MAKLTNHNMQEDSNLSPDEPVNKYRVMLRIVMDVGSTLFIDFLLLTLAR